MFRQKVKKSTNSTQPASTVNERKVTPAYWSKGLSSMVFKPDEKYLVGAYKTGIIKYWSIEIKESSITLTHEKKRDLTFKRLNHLYPLYTLLMSGDSLIIEKDQREIEVINSRNKNSNRYYFQRSESYNDSQDQIKPIMHGQNGSIIITGENRTSDRIITITNNKLIESKFTLPSPDQVCDYIIAQDKKTILAVCLDNNLLTLKSKTLETQEWHSLNNASTLSVDCPCNSVWIHQLSSRYVVVCATIKNQDNYSLWNISNQQWIGSLSDEILWGLMVSYSENSFIVFTRQDLLYYVYATNQGFEAVRLNIHTPIREIYMRGIHVIGDLLVLRSSSDRNEEVVDEISKYNKLCDQSHEIIKSTLTPNRLPTVLTSEVLSYYGRFGLFSNVNLDMISKTDQSPELEPCKKRRLQ